MTATPNKQHTSAIYAGITLVWLLFPARADAPKSNMRDLSMKLQEQWRRSNDPNNPYDGERWQKHPEHEDIYRKRKMQDAEYERIEYEKNKNILRLT